MLLSPHPTGSPEPLRDTGNPTSKVRRRAEESADAAAATATATGAATAPIPLTTTFTPPASCTQGQLTLIASPGYFVWMNEPVPASSVTFPDCYPSEFMQGYETFSSNPTTTGSRVPMMSPLVCPLGWHTVSQSGDYRACCPENFLLAPPATVIDPNRPAYGGTCFSDWTRGQTASVSGYDASTFTGMTLVEAITTPFQVYAHVMDGMAFSPFSLATTTSETTAGTSASTSDTSSSSGSTLPTGAVTGIVVGAVLFLSLLGLSVLLLFRRRRRRPSSSGSTPPLPPPKELDNDSPTTIASGTRSEMGTIRRQPTEMSPTSDVAEMNTLREPVEMSAAKEAAEVDGQERYQIGGSEIYELGDGSDLRS
ncbi:hypothetical protein F4780DRAFT_559204 [Xylariomycetidae sp. FL0641]|nr:hypothetical protein F4780DRAFT_559204 [Xylariomycetidae sp. FL0641]